MKKPLKFNDYKIISKFSFNELNRWVLTFYKQAFKDGQESIEPFDIECTLEPEDCNVAISTEELKEILMSVKGIGEKRADEVIQKLLDRGIDYSLWER